jgi:hypothetical protein
LWLLSCSFGSCVLREANHHVVRTLESPLQMYTWQGAAILPRGSTSCPTMGESLQEMDPAAPVKSISMPRL